MELLHVWLVIRWNSSMCGWLSDGGISDGSATCMVGYQIEELHVWLVIRRKSSM